VGVAAMLIAISLGTAIGAASGYMGGAVDHTLMRLTDLFLSIPALPLLLLIVYLFRDALKKAVGPEAGVFVLIVVVIGGLRWMPVARLVRAQFLSLREKEFAPHWAIFPGTAIFLTVLSINYIGDGLRDALDPRKVLAR